MIYMFGGSYAQPGSGPDSWVTKISDNYKVKNLAWANKSNAEMYLDLLSVKDKLKANDTIIVVWNDYLFPYINNVNSNALENKRDIISFYLKHLHNEELVLEHYKFYLNSFKQIAQERDVKLIALWSVPSNYINHWMWPWHQDHHLNYKKHTYAVDFPNDIRPSLMYFSKVEMKHLTDSEQEALVAKDHRPNHIANLSVHDEIYNYITQMLDNKLSGIVNLTT